METDNRDKIDLSIIIPCYNESHRIIGTLKELFAFLDLQSFTSEVRVMDDASTDNCVALMKEHFQRPDFYIHQFTKNCGKGYSIKVGVEESFGKYIMFMDADLSVPVEEILNLLKTLQDGYDVVLGIRIFHIQHASRIRRIIGFALLLYINIILPMPQVSDTQCGFKGFSRIAARTLFKKIRIHGGMFDVEVLFLANLLGYKMKSIPVNWYERPGSTIRIFRCLITDPFDIIKIRINSLLGIYL